MASESSTPASAVIAMASTADPVGNGFEVALDEEEYVDAPDIDLEQEFLAGLGHGFDNQFDRDLVTDRLRGVGGA